MGYLSLQKGCVYFFVAKKKITKTPHLKENMWVYLRNSAVWFWFPALIYFSELNIPVHSKAHCSKEMICLRLYEDSHSLTHKILNSKGSGELIHHLSNLK